MEVVKEGKGILNYKKMLHIGPLCHRLQFFIVENINFLHLFSPYVLKGICGHAFSICDVFETCKHIYWLSAFKFDKTSMKMLCVEKTFVLLQ